MKRIKRYVPYEWKSTPLCQSDIINAFLRRESRGDGRQVVDWEQTNKAISRQISGIIDHYNGEILSMIIKKSLIEQGYEIIIEVENG